MTDKEKLEVIRAEIHRLVEVRGYDREMANDLFAFIDSLPNDPVNEDLGLYINELSKQFPEVSFAKLSRIAVRVAKWQKEHLFNKLKENNMELQDEIKIGETKIYLEDDGGEPPYDGIQWLDLSCMEYEIPKDKFKDGDNVEIIIRKT